METEIRNLMMELFGYEAGMLIDKHLRESVAKDKEAIHRELRYFIERHRGTNAMSFLYIREGLEYLHVRMALNAIDAPCEEEEGYRDDDRLVKKHHSGFALPELYPLFTPYTEARYTEDYLKAYLRKKKISILQELPEKIDFLQNLASRMWRNIYV